MSHMNPIVYSQCPSCEKTNVPHTPVCTDCLLAGKPSMMNQVREDVAARIPELWEFWASFNAVR